MSEEKAFVNWVNTFNLPSPCQSFDDLSDGVILSHVFRQIDSESFPTVLTPIKDNTLVKYSNLRILLSEIRHFFEEKLQMECVIGLDGGNSVGEPVLKSDLTLLIGLALISAINCTNKRKFLSIILAIDAYDQSLLMTTIQEIQSRLRSGDTDDQQNFNTDDYAEVDEDWSEARVAENTEVEDLKKENVRLEKQIDEYKSRISQLEKEKHEWIKEKKTLQSPSTEQNEKSFSDRQLKEEFRAQVEELEFSLSQQELEISKYKKLFEEESSLRKKIEEDLELVQDEVSELRKFKAKAQNLEQSQNSSSYENLKHENELIKSELGKSQENLQKTKILLEEAKSKSRQIELELIDLQNEIDTKESENKKLIESKKKLEKEIKKLEESRSSSVSIESSGNLNPSLSDEKVLELKQELEESHKNLEELEKQYDNLKLANEDEKKKKIKIQKELDEALSTITTLKEISEQDKRNISELQRSLEHSNLRNVSLREDSETEKKAYIEQKTKENDELKVQIRRLHKKLQDYENQGNQFNLIQEKKLLMNHFYQCAKQSNPVRINPVNYSYQQQQQQQQRRTTEALLPK